MKSLKTLALVSLLCLFSYHIPLSAQADDVQSTVIQLADRIYRITLDFQLKPNIGISAGPDGFLLVDTGHAEVAPQLLSLIEKMGKGKIKFIINSHSHGDHAGGNHVFAHEAVIVAFPLIDDLVKKGVMVRAGDRIEGKTGKSFDLYYSMYFNGEEIKVIPSQGAHSAYDLIISFSESGVVHMGDLLLTQSFPAVGPRVKKYLEILDTAIDVFPEDTQFIGGHGRDYTHQDLVSYRKMLETTINIVLKEKAAGRSLEEMLSANILKDWESWGEFLTFLDTDSWIESVYTSFDIETEKAPDFSSRI